MNDDRRRAALAQATEQEYRACAGKIKWPSRKNAAAVARAQERTHRDGPMCAYKCRFCRCWHVGHDRHARSA